MYLLWSYIHRQRKEISGIEISIKKKNEKSIFRKHEVERKFHFNLNDPLGSERKDKLSAKKSLKMQVLPRKFPSFPHVTRILEIEVALASE